MPEVEECLKSVTLDPATLRAIAERDLCEKPSTRKKALREMRDWVKSSVHFQNCRTDSSFLLRFLRMQKFQTQEAQTVLEKYIKMRTQHPNWFQNLDIRDPKLSELIGRGYIFALPMRDSNGRRVVFSRAAAMDASRWGTNSTKFSRRMPNNLVLFYWSFIYWSCYAIVVPIMLVLVCNKKSQALPFYGHKK